MEVRITRRLKTPFLLLCLMSVIFTISAGYASGQKVRLRGFLNANCAPTIPSRPEWRYADIYGDGNIAVQGSSGCKGVFIYDITDPAQPVLASVYHTADHDWFPEAIVIGNRG